MLNLKNIASSGRRRSFGRCGGEGIQLPQGWTRQLKKTADTA